MQFVSDGAGERGLGVGGEGQEFASLSLKNVASPICPSALVHTRWSGRAGMGECSLSPFSFSLSISSLFCRADRPFSALWRREKA